MRTRYEKIRSSPYFNEEMYEQAKKAAFHHLKKRQRQIMEKIHGAFLCNTFAEVAATGEVITCEVYEGKNER